MKKFLLLCLVVCLPLLSGYGQTKTPTTTQKPPQLVMSLAGLAMQSMLQNVKANEALLPKQITIIKDLRRFDNQWQQQFMSLSSTSPSTKSFTSSSNQIIYPDSAALCCPCTRGVTYCCFCNMRTVTLSSVSSMAASVEVVPAGSGDPVFFKKESRDGLDFFSFSPEKFQDGDYILVIKGKSIEPDLRLHVTAEKGNLTLKP